MNIQRNGFNNEDSYWNRNITQNINFHTLGFDKNVILYRSLTLYNYMDY
jgi:hypothetical protein